VQVAAGPVPTGWLAQPGIGVPPSSNVTPPLSNAPPWAEAMLAVYVMLAPSFTIPPFGTLSVVEVGSRPTASESVALVEPATLDPGLAVNTAVRRAGDVEAANAVRQVTIWPCVDTGSFAQPLIGAAPFSNVTVPDGAVDVLEVTVAISVTC
jgi:hypothetical protein